MKKISFLKKVEPTVCEVMGQEVRLLFTMGAAAAMEDAFAQPYLQTILDMLQVPLVEGGEMQPPMPVERQAQIISFLASAAGQELEVAEVAGLPMPDFTVLAQAAQSEILTKTPWTKGDHTKKA